MNTQQSYIKIFKGHFLLIMPVLFMLAASASCNGCNGNNRAAVTGTNASLDPLEDLTPPVVILTIPGEGDVDVAINIILAASFSEEMEPSTINEFSFAVARNDAAPITGRVEVDATKKIATFTPDSDLEINTTYTATITTEVEDLAANALETDYVWQFTTGKDLDATAPEVTLTNPGPGDVDVAINRVVIANFNEEVNALTINEFSFAVIGNDAAPVAGTVEVDSTQKIATFTPDNDLEINTTYTATITTEAEDLAANALETDYVWQFTTGSAVDVTAPMVSFTVPDNGDIDVPVNQAVTASFSEAMKGLTITETSFTVTGPGPTPVSGTVEYSLAGSIATFTPDSVLENNTIYTATMTTDAKDLASNALAADYVWEFTTGDILDTTSPTIALTNPADADVNVALNKKITATFSEAMSTSTITTPGNFSVTGPGMANVEGSVDYDIVTNIATFTPDVNFAPGTTFVAAVTTAAQDLADNELGLDNEWSFTTGAEEAQTVEQVFVPLGSSVNFAILASAAITNIPTSTITGDVGLTPDAGSNISGFSVPATCPEVTGTVYAVDATGPACTVVSPTVLADAKEDAEIAFINARDAVRGTPQAISGNLNGLTLYPGVYESGSSIEISPGGFLYLDAQGDSNAIFIIRSATSITTGAGSEVVLTKGARANNVYWTAGSTVTLGTTSIMKGTMIAGTSISLLSGANLEGRALNQGAAAEAITLDSCTITVPAP